MAGQGVGEVIDRGAVGAAEDAVLVLYHHRFHPFGGQTAGGGGESGAASVLAVFSDGAPQITADPRFARHRRPAGGVDYRAVLAEPGWSPGQRALISLAAALSGCSDVPSEQLSAHLTGRQSRLVLAMCQAARSG